MHAIKMKTTYASPRGTFPPGTVLNVGDEPGQLPEAEAYELVDGHYAIPMDGTEEDTRSAADRAFDNQDENPSPEDVHRVLGIEDEPEEEIVNPKPRRTKSKAK